MVSDADLEIAVLVAIGERELIGFDGRPAPQVLTHLWQIECRSPVPALEFVVGIDGPPGGWDQDQGDASLEWHLANSTVTVTTQDYEGIRHRLDDSAAQPRWWPDVDYDDYGWLPHLSASNEILVPLPGLRTGDHLELIAAAAWVAGPDPDGMTWLASLLSPTSARDLALRSTTT